MWRISNECHFSALPKARNRLVLGALLLVVILLGLGSRTFGQAIPSFLAAHAGDALWTVAVYLTLAIAFPKWPPLKLGLLALAISLGVEMSQLIQAPWLEAIRETLPGRLLLGSGFLWADLLRYAVGTLIAVTLDRWWQSSCAPPR